MNILAIDTSSKHFSLAVAKDGKTLCYRGILLKKVLSDSIMPAIQGILKKAGLTLAKLDGFAVGLGPGSFTSLRVGLSTVKGSAFALKKPVVGVPSLDVLALDITGDGQVCVVCDAKRNMVYACLYQKKVDVLKRKSKYLLTDIQNVLKQIKGDVTFIGDGVPLFRETIEKAAGIKARFAGEKQMYPQAKHLAALTLKRFESKEYDAAESLVPLYLYPEDCQVQKRSPSTSSGSLEKESRAKSRKKWE
ncbi:MAG: tRNA (adenosine(37)-N6)-threonylcarbamoyltransferase complex dimerization subunit type 1 TsaB [Candidatus Omnitrophica bacterium]|nr:tRNA (adenosine(37)-N6)-threonylcarbamoyltransferase complex dimerization subunit type 1 TsaB [Candidatus Omnitrophota bacterium]